jgi:hypothetical protein
MTKKLKSYDVFYNRTKKSVFKVRAENEEQARIVADNFLLKDRHFDKSYDGIIEFDKVLDSSDPLPQPAIFDGTGYKWKCSDYDWE